MTIKLHRCRLLWVKGPHPCWVVQQALDESNIEYEVVGGPLRRGRRTDYVALTGQALYPAIELEDGRVVREPSRALPPARVAGGLEARDATVCRC